MTAVAQTQEETVGGDTCWLRVEGLCELWEQVGFILSAMKPRNGIQCTHDLRDESGPTRGGSGIRALFCEVGAIRETWVWVLSLPEHTGCIYDPGYLEGHGQAADKLKRI